MLEKFLYSIFLPIFIGGFIGWVTNYLAVLMLFRPHKEKYILGLKIQGVFPKRQGELANKIGQVISRELVTADEIKTVIADLAAEPRVLELVDAHIDKALREKIPLLGPLFAMAFNSEVIGKVKSIFSADIQKVIAGLATDVGGELESRLNIQEIVKGKIESFSSERLESLMMEIMRREFRLIEWVGAFLGALIAAVQVALQQLLYF